MQIPIGKRLKERAFLTNLAAQKDKKSPEIQANIEKCLLDFEVIDGVIKRLPGILDYTVDNGGRELRIIKITGVDARAIMKLRDWLTREEIDTEDRSEREDSEQLVTVLWAVW